MWLVLCTGNDNIHELTSAKNYTLRVDLADFEGNSRYAEYSNFNVASAADKYRLTSLGTYSGNAGTTIFFLEICQFIIKSTRCLKKSGPPTHPNRNRFKKSIYEMKWKCSDLKCIQKPTRSRLSLTHLPVQPLSRVKSLDGPRVRVISPVV